MSDLDRAISYYKTANNKNIHVSGSEIINMLNLLADIKNKNRVWEACNNEVSDLERELNQSQLDLEQANVKIKLLEAQIIFVEKTSIAKQVQADKDIQELAKDLKYASGLDEKWLDGIEFANKYLKDL